MKIQSILVLLLILGACGQDRRIDDLQKKVRDLNSEIETLKQAVKTLKEKK